MRIRTLLATGAAGLTAAALVTAVAVSPVTAAAPLPVVAGNTTVLPDGPRLVPSPGSVVNAGQTITLKVAGETFSGRAIPANATGVVLSVSSLIPTAAGDARVWATGGGMPGTPTVSFVKGEKSTSVAFVGLNDSGSINVYASVKTNVIIGISAYVTPLAAPAAPVVKTIAAAESKTLDQVGGSIRGDAANNLKGATAFGSVVLPAGTWDARVVAGFTGLNNSNKECTTGDNFLTGSMVIVKGDGSADPNRLFDFDQVAATTGGVVVPESNSTTLTQDPTLSASTFITLAEDTKVTVRLFGYASDSSTSCTGTLKGNLQSASFLKVG